MSSQILIRVILGCAISSIACAKHGWLANTYYALNQSDLFDQCIADFGVNTNPGFGNINSASN